MGFVLFVFERNVRSKIGRNLDCYVAMIDWAKSITFFGAARVARGGGGGEKKEKRFPRGYIPPFANFVVVFIFVFLGPCSCLLAMVAYIVVVWKLFLLLRGSNLVGNRCRVYLLRARIGFVVRFAVVGQ